MGALVIEVIPTQQTREDFAEMNHMQVVGVMTELLSKDSGDWVSVGSGSVNEAENQLGARQQAAWGRVRGHQLTERTYVRDR
jgi:hypothetical protein